MKAKGQWLMICNLVFAVDVDGRPTLAFEAKNRQQALEISKESWLRDDLVALESGGVQLCRPRSKLSVRRATPQEAAIFSQAADAAKSSDDMVLAFLVDLDD